MFMWEHGNINVYELIPTLMGMWRCELDLTLMGMWRWEARRPEHLGVCGTLMKNGV